MDGAAKRWLSRKERNLADKEKPRYAIGLDFGTNSVRTLIVDVRNGRRSRHRDLQLPDRRRRDHPRPQGPQPGPAEPGRLDLRGSRRRSGRRSPRPEGRTADFAPKGVIGIGVDTTGSTPLPVDRAGKPLAFYKEFRKNPNAHGLALEGPHRPRRGRRDHGPGRERASGIPGQVRRDLFLRVVLEQDPPLPAGRPEGLGRRLLLGRMRRLHPGRAHRHDATR